MLHPLLRRLPSITHPLSTASVHRRRCAAMAESPARYLTVAATPKASLKGVVFDMDGTLTVPVIDFPAMYRTVLGEDTYASLRSASPSGGIDILHHIETWAPAEQQRAYEIIAHFEQQGLDRLQIMPGALELCRFLDSKKIRRGLITRNVDAAVDLFHQRFGIMFAPALSREFRPYKPDPAPLLHICSTWGVSPNEVMMIGDSLRDDVVCGRRAGAFTCLLDETGRYESPDCYTDEQKPDFKVSSLEEVHPLLEDYFNLVPASQTA
ncbi:haloacid dehalogenase-like hydrolase domain-containing protein At2g33255 isoform X2 [Dioscorea cayenensis subsp. rotundata]|uniref:Haloacid dehalogenase-like hydrolase domain-containing protein At2g33255 isoform X1 n=1 Tax=Dioscorea cayennensis subsp. rotundata TaxID=55577 RepID=A0AB40BI18_DIOCR|nr:haloacid dehalogenase-like hydrolase domain-containing protein At2g33255 isoform X1 [Dioscorea cayenensis subsp. rotundata]XP_039127037.1 haloacid dehalogenase-like hydrolase domain-containing protein At2g33255 isoform X2 [Dioscorea cayenensis subsp. rotundata]